MFSISAIKGKFERSGIDFRKTFLWEKLSPSEKQIFSTDLRVDEIGIITYKESEVYSWLLTSERIIIQNANWHNLSDLKKVDINNIKMNPNEKISNRELTLFTNSNNFKLFLEENSWHVFYSIFKFIIDKNN
ncbi:hypothetical protein [Flavobacterium adhaerens]|uniref:hypothetical protein n=1 Tax=Flavobacterium adhaerens TaxID=3149043 RepID=UPI0032B5238A